MTCIAWDGKTLAADKQSTSHGMRRTTTKIHRVSDGMIAMCGGGAHCYALLAWFKSQRNPEEWPQCTDEDSSGSVIHFTRDGVFVYNGAGFPCGEPIEDKFIAFGCGRDYAMAAMHLGRTAIEAVEVACVFDTGCGMGIDTLEFEP